MTSDEKPAPGSTTEADKLTVKTMPHSYSSSYSQEAPCLGDEERRISHLEGDVYAWDRITWSVKGRDGKSQVDILKGVSGVARSSQMVAIVGTYAINSLAMML